MKRLRFSYYQVFGLLLFILAVVVRFYDLPNRVIFTEDHALFNIFAYRNIIYHERLQVGPSIGGVWATFPPTFYYLTTFLIKISGFNYYVLHVLTAVANLGALLLILTAFPSVFGKRVALVTAFLYSFSFFVVSQSIVGTNPGVLPPLTVILIVTTIWVLRDKKYWALPILALDISLMTHFHVTPFFLIPALLLIFVVNSPSLIKHWKTALIFGVMAALIVIYVGVRPHYLQDKAFGGQNLARVKQAVLHGTGGPKISKLDSSINFLSGLIRINSDLFFPDSSGYQENTPTNVPMTGLGLLITSAVIVYAIISILKNLILNTAPSILGVLFLSDLLFMTIIPSYLYLEKPVRWLDALYFPLFFMVFSNLIVSAVENFLKGRRLNKSILAGSVFVLCLIFLTTNGNKWITDGAAEGRLKLKTIIKKVDSVAKAAVEEKNINLVHLGNVNLNPTWPFAFALWKETGDNKYLRTLLWNIDPQRNEPFYIFSDVGDDTLVNSEKAAKGFQDSPQILKIDMGGGFLVEKVFSDSL